jgi:hypothetical protein
MGESVPGCSIIGFKEALTHVLEASCYINTIDIAALRGRD